MTKERMNERISSSPFTPHKRFLNAIWLIIKVIRLSLHFLHTLLFHASYITIKRFSSLFIKQFQVDAITNV